MRLIVQCAYSEKYTTLQVRQQHYPRPSRTIVRLLRNSQKNNFTVKLSWKFIRVYMVFIALKNLCSVDNVS